MQQASIPMYLFRRDAVDALWQALAQELRNLGVADVPEALTWPEDYHAHWLQPDLLLSQACGYPFIDDLDGRVQLVGCLHYDVPGCTGYTCRSVLLTRAEYRDKTLSDFRGLRVAFNDERSQSGYNAPRALVAPLAHEGAFFAEAIETGSHQKSIEALRLNQVDIACIDCVSYAGLVPAPQQDVAVIGYTEPYPGLPLITSASTSPATLQALRTAWQRCLQRDDTRVARAALFITGFEIVPAEVYARCREMCDQALAFGYPSLFPLSVHA